MKNLAALILLFTTILNTNSQWVEIKTSISANLFGISALSPSLIFAVGTGQSFVTKSTNGGLSWITLNAPQEATDYFLISAVNENHIWLISGSNTSRIFNTTNGGINWTEQFFSYNRCISYIKFFNENTGFFIADPKNYPNHDTLGFFYTRNGGQTWIRPPNCPIVRILGYGYSGCKDSNLIWTTANYNNNYRLCKLTGGFNSAWQIIDRESSNFFGDRLLFYDINNGLSVGIPATWQTTNGGINWFHKSDEGLTGPSPVIYVNNIKGTSWVIAHCANRYRISYDYCNSWQPVVNLPLSIRLHQLDFSDSNSIYIACDSGKVLKYDSDKIGINPISNIIPEKFKLYQNYPNPFNPSTKIKFDIPKASFVKLIIYDIIGKEVSVLVNEELNAGKYNYDLSGINLTSGIYFYKLTTDEYNKTKKLILLK